MSHAHDHANTVPRPALAMAGALVGVSLLMTAAVTFGLLEREAVPAVERSNANVGEHRSRTLTFADQPDGSVRVADAATGATVASFVDEDPGSGFIRGVMRGLARDRQMRGIGAEPPFVLTQWQDGALSLTDSATDRTVELGGFGPDNRATFARLLEDAA
jgi:putative photosynthetic complex assembly protein